jgi:hypothetical protein
MKSDAFRLKWRVKFFGSSNASLSGACRQLVLQCNTEEIVRNESEDGSLKEFGSVSLPRKLRMALSKAVFEPLKPTVS